MTTATHAVRPSLRTAIDEATASLADAGTWLDGATIGELLRAGRRAETCRACRDRRKAVSPMADTGPHSNPDGLGDVLLDLTHRVRTDSGRLTQAWADRCMEALGAGPFVEAAGLVATLAVIDSLANAIGEPRQQLPTRSSAPATLDEPEGLTIRHCWVPTVDPDQASGVAAGLYAGGGLATVVEALTMSPHATAVFWPLVSAMYIKPGTAETVDDTVGGLTLSDVELLAARVSALNECFY